MQVFNIDIKPFIKYRKFTNILIHCYAGVSRSVTIVCAYIMWKFKWNF